MTSPVEYFPGFISPTSASKSFNTLWNDLAWVRHADVPRREYWTNLPDRPYTYGRGMGVRTYQPQPSHPLIDAYRIELSTFTGPDLLEGCFLNGYENNRDALGWHADDDPNIDHHRAIAVITLGQPRNIQFRKVIKHGNEDERSEFDSPETLMLENGSLLLMLPGMQQTYQHRIPKAGFVAMPRISLTYRGLKVAT